MSCRTRKKVNLAPNPNPRVMVVIIPQGRGFTLASVRTPTTGCSCSKRVHITKVSGAKVWNHRWRQRSALAFGAKSLVCTLRHPIWHDNPKRWIWLPTLSQGPGCPISCTKGNRWRQFIVSYHFLHKRTTHHLWPIVPLVELRTFFCEIFLHQSEECFLNPKKKKKKNSSQKVEKLLTCKYLFVIVVLVVKNTQSNVAVLSDFWSIRPSVLAPCLRRFFSLALLANWLKLFGRRTWDTLNADKHSWN